MIWLAGILAIALMLAILELDPSQLYALSNLSHQVNSERWQAAAYLLLALIALLYCLSYLVSLFLKTKTSLLTSSPSLSITPLYITPYAQLRQQGFFQPLIKLATLLLLLFAVLCNSVAQRLAFIEASPQNNLYIEAVVTPIGLSDKRLAIEEGEVVQGYRQLVELSDIQADSLQQGTTVTPDSAVLNKLPATMTVMLQSYQSQDSLLNQLAPNQQLRMKLALQPLEIKDKANADEFDEYRWLSSRHATAKAFVVDTNYALIKLESDLTLHQKIDVMRYQFREHFLQLMTDRSQQANHESSKVKDSQDEVAVTLSLLTGDRSLISDDMTALYQFGGISHLLAISGTHVLFLSLLCAALATAVINRIRPSIYHWLPRWQCAFFIAAITAFGYALFAGFDVPALRTACMLLLVGIMRYFLAVPSIFKKLLVLAVAMAWADVFVLWQAGFWLSFVAVAVLVAYSQRWQRVDKQVSGTAAKAKQHLFSLFKLQLWMSLALLPISLWLFGKVSLWGFVINLFAIGLFGSIIVPINLLASVLFVLMPNNALSAALWSLLFWILDQLHSLLQLLQLTFQQSGWLYSEISLPLMGLLLLMALPWVLPKSMLSRGLSAVPLLAIAAMVYANEDVTKDSVHINVLNPKDFNYAASLIQDKQQAWLLLSSYEKEYKTEKASQELTLKQQIQLSQRLYDQLKEHKVEQLTGVIVQTATTNLAPVVAQLNEYMPISYYWQAGLAPHKLSVDKALMGSSLQAQSCHATKQWPESSQAEPLSLKVLTGWEQVKDNRVWDCTIEVATRRAIYLSEQGKTEQLFAAVGPMVSGDKEEATSNINSQSSNLLNKAVFYSSSKPQWVQLWQLMCESQTQSHDTWLTPSQSIIEKSMVDSFSPQQWRIIGENHASATLPLKESYLYWQQLKN
mgnify:CR=1 FL=1